MSTTISLKHSMARRSTGASNIIQHCIVIAALLVVFAVINIILSATRSTDTPPLDCGGVADIGDLAVLSEELDAAAPDAYRAAAAVVPAAAEAPVAAVLSPRMQGALDYVKRRYKVSPQALVPVFEVAQLIGNEMRIDPLLIVAIIGIESGFNPFAESAMGARGLMQVIPRFHRDKVPPGAGDGSLLDPLINIRVGVRVLEEAIRRGGSLVAGLQQYAGSSEPEGLYASKVLAEKERLEQAARRNRAVAINAEA